MHKLKVFKKEQKRKHYQHENVSGYHDNDNLVEISNSKNYNFFLPKIFSELKSITKKE